MKKLLVASLFVIGTVAVAASAAQANVLGEQEQKQEAKQEAETTCTGGAYGQETKCSLKTTQSVKQEQRQKILGAADVVKEGRGGKVHVPVNTALDTRTLSMLLAAGVLGVSSSVALTKIK